MNLKSNHCLLATAAFVITGSVFAQEPEQPVNVDVEGLPSHVAGKVQDKAKQGPTELRRFVNRTRIFAFCNIESCM